MEKMTVTIKSKAVDFDLPGVDGQNHSLKELSGKKAVIVIFSCNHCPYVQAYEDRIIQIQNDYAAKGAQIVAINSNEDVNHPDDSFENMVKRAKEKKFNFLYLRDETQSAARDYGATHTPHIFLFDQKRELRYTGKIDDNWQEASKVKRRYLREALDALLEGKEVPEPETHAIGCTIKWR
jgi:peroxiredoxin